MYALDPSQVRLLQQVAHYDRTARYRQEIADMIKDADFAGHTDFTAPPRPEPASRLGLRALVGRLVRRSIAEA